MSDHDQPPTAPLSSEYRQEWERARERMRVEVGNQKYETWFSALELLRREANVLHLTMPTKFLRNWMNQHYLELIRARIAAEFRGVDKVIIVRHGSVLRVKLSRPNDDDAPRGVRPLAILEVMTSTLGKVP